MPFELFEHLVVGPLGCNCYIVGDSETNEALIIDPGGDPHIILEALAVRGLTPVAQVATHAHFDHVLAADAIRERTGAPFLLHADDSGVLAWMQESLQFFLGIEGPPPPQVDGSPGGGESIEVGAVQLEVIHTPGHSPGSITLHVADVAVFVGDVLFAGSVGRTDLPGGDFETLEASIKDRLFCLGDLMVYPGHGPATSLEREKLTNPFVGTSPGLWTP